MNIFKNGVGRPSNNIKRARVIIAVIAVILSATIGYALFSQQVKVTGTATASGTFQITPTCRLATDSEAESYYENINSATFHTSDESCTVNGNSITANATLKQPGALAFFMITLTNSGTIDATIKSITVTSSTTGASILYSGSVDYVQVSSKDMNKYIDLWNYKMLTGSSELASKVDLTAGSSEQYLLFFEWNELDTNQTPMTLNGTFTFNFEQKTN